MTKIKKLHMTKIKTLQVHVCVLCTCVCVHACVCTSKCVCMYMCVCACVYVYLHTFKKKLCMYNIHIYATLTQHQDALTVTYKTNYNQKKTT